MVLQYYRRFNIQIRGVQTIYETIYQSRNAQPSARMVDLLKEEDFEIAKQVMIQTPCAVEHLPRVKEGGVDWFLFVYGLEVEVVGASVLFSAR